MSAKILIVDDELDVRDLLADCLRMANYCVVDIENAVSIEETMLREKPDVVLLDITMPDVDGFEALRRIKSNPALRSIPVIMASAQSRTEVMLEAQQAGAFDFLVKPWQNGELEWRVGEALRYGSENAA